MAWQTSLRDFWKDPQYSDVRLQLYATAAAPPAQSSDEQPTSSRSSHSSDSLDDVVASRCRVPDAPAVSPESSPAVAARRHSDSGACSAHRLAAPGAAALTGGTCARTYHLHAMVLGSASGHFKALISSRKSTARSSCGSGSSGGAAAADDGGGVGPATLQLVEHVAEGEVDAVEAVLRHCYTGQLCDEGSDAAQLSLHSLLQMMVLSNRFDIPLCMSHSCEELAKRGAAEHDIASINAVFADRSAGWHSLAAAPRVVAAASERLMQLLGDADAVCSAFSNRKDSELQAQLRHLSLPSLLVLLASSDLEARSENSVLILADWWVRGEGGAGAACGAAQRRQVAAMLRLGQLSHTFLWDVLPALRWLDLGDDELRSLMRFDAAAAARPPPAAGGAAPPAAPGELSHLQKHLAGGRLAGPPAWYQAQRRAAGLAPPQMLMAWEMTEARLAEELKGVHPLSRGPQSFAPSGSTHYFNGFWARLVIVVTTAGAGCGAFVGVQVGVGAQASIPLRGVHVAAEFGVQRGKSGTDDRLAWDGHVECKEFCPQAVMKLELLPGLQLKDVAAWGSYLRDGVLRVQCTVTACE